MPDLSDPTQFSQLVQTGGVVAFAAAVLMQLRDLKPLLAALKDGNAQMNALLTALLERERVRVERSQAYVPTAAAAPQMYPPSELVDYRGTPVVQMHDDETPPLGTVAMSTLIDPTALPAASSAPVVKRTATPAGGTYMVVKPRGGTEGGGGAGG